MFPSQYSDINKRSPAASITIKCNMEAWEKDSLYSIYGKSRIWRTSPKSRSHSFAILIKYGHMCPPRVCTPWGCSTSTVFLNLSSMYSFSFMYRSPHKCFILNLNNWALLKVSWDLGTSLCRQQWTVLVFIQGEGHQTFKSTVFDLKVNMNN